MSIVPYQNGNFAIRKNDIIFLEGQSTQSVNILLQGKIDVFMSPYENHEGMTEEGIIKNSFRIFSLEQNIFTGANDLFTSDRYSFSYRASADSSIYIYMSHNISHVKALMSSQKDYGAYMMASIANLISNSYSSFTKLERFLGSIRSLTNNLIMFFWALKERYGFTYTPSSRHFREGLGNINKVKEKNIVLPASFDVSFIERDYSDILDIFTNSPDEDMVSKVEYYKCFLNIPADIRKSFYGSDVTVTCYQYHQAANFLAEIQSNIKDVLSSLKSHVNILYSESEESILSEYVKAASELKKSDSDSGSLLQALDFITAKFKNLISVFEDEYSYKVGFNMDDIKNMISRANSPDSISGLKETSSGPNVQSGGNAGSIPDELIDSAYKIVEYSGIPEDRAVSFMRNLETFRNLKDRLSTDNDVRNLRNAITGAYFDIYEAVLKRVLEEKNTTPLYHMFLSYSFMDEKLLSPEHTIALYNLINKPAFCEQYPIYSMRDWLIKIYSLDKEPSINEFGQDYNDVFREMKKRKQVTDKEKSQYDNDTAGRLSFEVKNMFRINQKLCHGQISVYFPILHDEMITRDLSKAFVTPDMLAESLNKILEVDFSVFHREVSFRNAEKGIEKEFVMKPVLPDIILMPTFGTRAIMWQEVTGRSRSTPGRFIFPAFTAENIDELMVKLVGNFRWELCRTMMGVSWNDITQKSLTSEYTDYIQFFKKNRDLSEEAKERVKKQIQKYRNSLRDIFTSDYEIWLNYESKGIMRLSKVVRKILYNYCPFAKPIRENLEKQPAFTDIASQFNNVRTKQAKEFENRYSRFIKNGSALDPDLEHNLKFYKEM